MGGSASGADGVPDRRKRYGGEGVYQSRGGPGGPHLVFSAETANIDRAVAEVSDYLSGHGRWPLFEIKLLLREALLNAVLHGGGGPRREVSCRVRLAGDAVECTVSDQGPGFDWRARLGRLPSPEAESGRGICIMQAYADELIFNAAGNVVRLVKKRSGPSPGTDARPDDTGKTT
ncbi:hypothetical protein GD604_17675 [Desulfolutivibrio sulfoxidireducens]|nr:hypothetical protein GD604_17675 [Desulfolutivibrio sulfoxidireducens]